MAEDDETVTADAPSIARPAVEDNSLGRLLTLADGVFAIAMTLLALDLRVPDLDHPTDAALRHALADNSSSYLTFLLSFYVVANYWLRHRRLMRAVVTIHPALIRDTMFLLVIVVAMPFFAALLSRYGAQATALALYGAANVVAVLTLMLLSRDVTRLGLADPGDPNEPGDDYVHRWQTWLSLGTFALCIPAGYVLGHNGPWVLVLLAIPNRMSWLRRVFARTRRPS